MSQLDLAGRFAPGRRGRTIRVAVAVVALVAAALIFRKPLFFENFGVVDPGRVFRSAQPSSHLGDLLNAYQPASILNLRGGSWRDDWYTAEVRSTEERSIDFYDLPLSAIRRPRRRELLILLDLLGRCRYPLLIHCKSGSDRTGLASALYRMAILGEPPERALDAFTITYGHFPIGGPEHLHEPLIEYADWLEGRGLEHDPARFRDWVEHDYEDDEPAGVVPTLRPGSRWRGVEPRQRPSRVGAD